MLQNEQKKPFKVIIFQLCIIANAVFGSDAELYQLSKIIMLAFFLVEAYNIFANGGKMRVGSLIVLPVIFTAYSALSIAWAYNSTVAANQFTTQIQLSVLLVFTYLVMLDGATLKDYLDAVYIAGYGMAVFGLVRYGGLSNYIDVMESGDRLGGSIANQNTYGLIFANASLAAAYYLAFKKEKRNLISIAIFTFFALSSGSKKATLMIILGILFIFAMELGIKKIYKTVLVGAAVLFVAWWVLQLPLFATINERLTSFFSGELNDSDRIRSEMIEYGKQLIAEKPLFGYGLTNFSVLYHMRTYSHNNFIEVAVSLGTVGFVMYYLMYAIPLFQIAFGRNRKENMKDGLINMLIIWLVIDLVFGYGMVQMYDKTSYLIMGVALSQTDKINMGIKEI